MSVKKNLKKRLELGKKIPIKAKNFVAKAAQKLVKGSGRHASPNDFKRRAKHLLKNEEITELQ